MNENDDYSAYLIEMRQSVEVIASHARNRRYFEAATQAAALATVCAKLASALTRAALRRNTF